MAIGAVSGCLGDANDSGGSDGSGADDPNDTNDTDDSNSDGGGVNAYERAVHELVNGIRRERDLEPFAYNEEIAAIARGHSEDMVERGYFGHESPDGNSSSDRLDEFIPGRCMGIAENIVHVAGGPDVEPETVAERALSLWMDSSGHRRSILSETFDEEGIGVAFSDERAVITQNFCALDS